MTSHVNEQNNDTLDITTKSVKNFSKLGDRWDRGMTLTRTSSSVNRKALEVRELGFT